MSAKRFAIDGVAIPKKVPRCRVPGKSLQDLLGRPCSGRMLSHVKMNHASALMCSCRRTRIFPGPSHSNDQSRSSTIVQACPSTTLTSPTLTAPEPPCRRSKSTARKSSIRGIFRSAKPVCCTRDVLAACSRRRCSKLARHGLPAWRFAPEELLGAQPSATPTRGDDACASALTRGPDKNGSLEKPTASPTPTARWDTFVRLPEEARRCQYQAEDPFHAGGAPLLCGQPEAPYCATYF